MTADDYNLLPDELSAKTGFTTMQAILFWFFCISVITGLALFRESFIIGLSIIFSLFYLSVVLFRALVLADFDNEEPVSPVLLNMENDKHYVILSAVYKEQNMIGDLIKSLDRLRWKKGHRSIYLICEATDKDTIAAVRSNKLPDDFHLLIVPDSPLRTKPRALNYALKQVSGDYLVIYDAEDRPHPNQLLEAASTFEKSPQGLVCLQAPLTIDNAKESLITRLFAVEYATLFHGILPAIADMKAPMPLGGTSNHFKLNELISAGGWDSYNVTEDADLGIRLARKGKLCGVIHLPTFEEAPHGLVAWTKQRTRWIKGWMQTLQVHFRNPTKTAREMGFGDFVKFNMILTSVVVSVLIHPLFLVAFFFQMSNYFSGNPLNAYDISITALSAFNLIAGYTTYWLLAFAVLNKTGKRDLRPIILLLPFYWLMISIAGWRAVWQMVFSPHHWEKTSHGSTKRPPID